MRPPSEFRSDCRLSGHYCIFEVTSELAVIREQSEEWGHPMQGPVLLRDDNFVSDTDLASSTPRSR